MRLITLKTFDIDSNLEQYFFLHKIRFFLFTSNGFLLIVAFTSHKWKGINFLCHLFPAFAAGMWIDTNLKTYFISDVYSTLQYTYRLKGQEWISDYVKYLKAKKWSRKAHMNNFLLRINSKSTRLNQGENEPQTYIDIPDGREAKLSFRRTN